ncbi:MAG: HD domain-containing protein [Candidatus Micrarchaeia archaeon]
MTNNLKTQTERAQKVLDFVLREIQADGKRCESHGLAHVLRVWRAGLEISAREGGNLEVLEPALLLHDIIRPGDEAGEREHARLSADFAESVLAKFGYSNSEAMEIREAILTHSRSSPTESPKTLEAKILYDADKLDGLGAEGVKRALSLGKGRKWNEVRTAEWYLARTCDVARNEPFFTGIGAEKAGERLGASLDWCKKTLPREAFAGTLRKFGFNNAAEIKLTRER